MSRVVADCRKFPSAQNCTLTISGTPEEVMKAALEHAIGSHGHKDSQELREQLRQVISAEGEAEELEETVKKRFDKPDEQRPFVGHGHLDVLDLGGGVVMGRAVFEPGWKWSVDVRPIAGTASCQSLHTGYVLRGKMTVKMDDGTEIKFKAGDAFHIPPGHDAWVEGKDRCECLDVTGFVEYAKRPAKEAWPSEEEPHPVQ